MGDDETTFGSQLLLSLPAMSASDWEDAQRDWASLSTTAQDTTTVEDEYLQRSCALDNNDNSWTALMKEVYTQLQDYQASRYDNDSALTTRRLTLEPAENSNDMVVRTYLEILDAPNCKTGRMAVTWQIQPALDANQNETTAQVSGAAQLHICYSENDANVQLRASQDFTTAKASTAEEKVHSIVAQMEERTMSYEKKVARAVVAQVKAHETAWVQSLQAQLASRPTQHLKALRRILPITKTRFQWDAAVHKQVQLLNAREKHKL